MKRDTGGGSGRAAPAQPPVGPLAVPFAISPDAGPDGRLTYTLTAPTTLTVAFAMLPPGGGTPQPIAAGTPMRSC